MRGAGLALACWLALALPVQAADTPLTAARRAEFEALKASLGPDDDRTLAAELNLATALAGQDAFADAVAHIARFRQVMVARSGEDGPEALMAGAIMASFQAYQGDRDAAVALARQIQARASRRGPGDPVAIIAEAALGGALSVSGRYDEAQPHLEAGYQGMVGLYGPTALETRQIGASLVTNLLALGYNAEAQQIRRQLAAAPRPGAPEAEVLLAAALSVQLLSAEGRYAEARDLGQPLVARLTALRGPDHSTTLDATYALAGALAGAGDPRRAGDLQEGVYRAYGRLRGPDDLLTLKTGEVLAVFWRATDDPARRAAARALMSDLQARRQRVNGPTAPTTLLNALNLAMMSFEDAERLNDRAVFRQAIEALVAIDDRLARDPAQARSLVATGVNTLLGIQLINQGQAEQAYLRLSHSAETVMARSTDRRVAANGADAIGVLNDYRYVFTGQIRAGWVWAHQP
ncbi:hypothetical protein CSW58_08155 [Caulobacter sp. B11]|uniref:hypothetical protein n=1 Tax=Caulobacter sp. B11 TaxID=2048899 RepID=UPI000C12B5F0|nr:hypothetical protein [Caulobacter sp. B11]PHY13077.1 hypothetical protein CSW58_08155 [Caulobacter sp. B11]